MYSYRTITPTTEWSDFRRRIISREEDPSGLTPRVAVPKAVTDFCGAPPTDDVVIATGAVLHKVYETSEKFGVPRTTQLRRQGATTRSMESDWLAEAIMYLPEGLPSGFNVEDVIPRTSIDSLEAACREWLGPGELLFGVKDVAPRPDTPAKLKLVVTWSGFINGSTPGVPWRAEYYRQTDEFHRFIVANPANRELLWTPHVERAAQFRWGDAGGSFISQYHGVYTNELLDNWEPHVRIPLGLRALPTVHPGNIPATLRNNLLRNQDDAFDEMMSKAGTVAPGAIS